MVMRSAGPKRDAEAELKLPPGFRFHPTDDELVLDYLCRKVSSRRLPVPIIADVDLYRFDPWDLPEMALFGQKEWYFFTPRDRKYPNGSRPNRAAGGGYWKATGADKPVRTDACTGQPLGIKKALVFYHGKAPRGVKTDWIMHEYRLVNNGAGRAPAHKASNLRLDDWVLCRLYNKKNSWNKQPSAGAATTSHDSGSEGIMSAQESDVEHGDFAAQAPWKVGGNNMFDEQTVVTSSVQKQESEWFTDPITLDNLQESLTGFGSMPTTTTMGGPIQDYNFFLGPGYM